jgi:hypothetical protein
MTPKHTDAVDDERVKLDGSASLPSILREGQLWLLVMATVEFFYRPLFTRATFYFRDLYLHYIQRKQQLADLVRAGELPLWNELRQGGA